MPEIWIDPEWLASARGLEFFYPNAGYDHADALAAFVGISSSFCFCDINYCVGLRLSHAIADGGEAEFVSKEVAGNSRSRMGTRIAEGGRTDRFLEPSRLTETYRLPGGQTFCVIRRRGFGQMALAKGSIGVFMHRRDSAAEGGSKRLLPCEPAPHLRPVQQPFREAQLQVGRSGACRLRRLECADPATSQVPQFPDRRSLGVECVSSAQI